MGERRPADLPAYAAADVKSALLAAGASGTIYSLVMPESEQALAFIVDGGERQAREAFFSRYHEPWTQKQDSMHEEYFEHWLRWSAPVVSFRPQDFPFRYPTAGASEAIFKLIAEFESGCRAEGREPAVHMFEGEYEGFAAYAEALKVRTVRHDRAAWNDVPARLDSGSQFWISQPSAVDGMVWPHFEAFAAAVGEHGRGAQMAIYLEFPQLRPLTFDHPIFMDRFLFPEGDFSRPDPRLLDRWRSERDILFQELMYERTRAILADESEVDPDDPQIVWLRRYGEQGGNWVRVWSKRFQQVEDAMIRLREAGAEGDRASAARRHLDWLLSPEIAEGATVPFWTEAVQFRDSFDALIAVYDEAMAQARQVPVKGTGEQ